MAWQINRVALKGRVSNIVISALVKSRPGMKRICISWAGSNELADKAEKSLAADVAWPSRWQMSSSSPPYSLSVSRQTNHRVTHASQPLLAYERRRAGSWWLLAAKSLAMDSFLAWAMTLLILASLLLQRVHYYECQKRTSVRVSRLREMG